MTRPSLRWEGRILDRVEEKRDGLADVNDPSLWWIPRLIGGFFVVFAVLLLVVFGFRR